MNMNIKIKNPYTGTTPTEGMSDEERKTFIRRRIIELFDERKVNCTVNEDIVQHKPRKTASIVEIADVYFDLLQEFLTDEKALYWIEKTFGKYSKDDMVNLRFRIFDSIYKKYCSAPFLKPNKAKEIFLNMIERSYIDTFDLCCTIMAEKGIFCTERSKKGLK